MSKDDKAFAMVIALLIGALGFESAKVVHRVLPRPPAEAAHTLKILPR